ncbi:MAG: hypothetical protein R3D98_16930 [Candidatus Krumholzibacteriia bacterium]
MIPAAGRAWRNGSATLPFTAHPAVVVMGVLLLVITCMAARARWLPLPALAVAVGLARAGLRWRALPALLAPWSLLAAVVLAAHTVSATDVAPLWHPSLTGLARGTITLGRLALVLATVALAGRFLSLRDLTTAFGWWLGPLRRFGVDTRHLGLTVAVALGTAPRTLAEADRLVACLRLRRRAGARRPWQAFTDHVRAVPPLMDGLMRRAETLPLALAHRVPADATRIPGPPWYQFVPLAAWLAALVWVRR